MLNARGGVEALPVVARLGPESFLLLAGPEQSTRLGSWIDWHKPASGVTMVDVTSGFAGLELAVRAGWPCCGASPPPSSRRWTGSSPASSSMRRRFWCRGPLPAGSTSS